MKTGLIDIGGGERGIYGAGIMDRLDEEGIVFDVAIGVSAGSANLSSFLSRQRGRNRRFYTVYSLRDDYMSRKNIRDKGYYIDLNYAYGTLSRNEGEDPLDYRAFIASPTEFVAVATAAESGKVRYFTKEQMKEDDFSVLMASSALPGASRPYEVEGDLYFDGAVSDPVPVAKALEMGCDRIVLICNSPLSEAHDEKEDLRMARRMKKSYPAIAETLYRKEKIYEESLALAGKLAEEGRLLLLAPDDSCGVDVLCRSAKAMNDLYAVGYEDGRKVAAFLFR